MSAELVAIIAVGCTIVGLLLVDRRHVDVRMDGMQAALAVLGERVAHIDERVACIEGMLAVLGHTGERPPEM